MSVLIPNSFSSYDLSDDEYEIGCILTITQLQVIQNELALTAEVKLHLTFEQDSLDVYLRENAKLQGSLDALQAVIVRHETAVENIELRNNPIDPDE